jgi:hypothetical protein
MWHYTPVGQWECIQVSNTVQWAVLTKQTSCCY